MSLLSKQFISFQILTFAAVLVFTQSCASGDFAKDKLKEDGRATSPRPDSEDSSPAEDIDSLVFKGKFHLIVTGKYKDEVFCEDKNASITVTLKNVEKKGEAVCNTLLKNVGVESISIASDPGEKTINIKQIDIPKLKDGEGNPLDNRVKYASSKGTSTFSPGLPRHIGPIIQDPSTYRNSDGTYFETTVKGLKAVSAPTDPSDELGRQEGTGSVRIAVEGIDEEYTSPVTHKVYSNVLTYSVYAEGFESIKQKADADLYTKITYRWQTGSTDVSSDLRLLSVEISGPVSDFRSGLKAFLGGSVLFRGQMNISLHLTESESDD